MVIRIDKCKPIESELCYVWSKHRFLKNYTRTENLGLPLEKILLPSFFLSIIVSGCPGTVNEELLPLSADSFFSYAS